MERTHQKSARKSNAGRKKEKRRDEDRPTPRGGIANDITNDLSCAIAQARRAEMRLAKALDLCPPHALRIPHDQEIWESIQEIELARIEFCRAAAYAKCAMETWRDSITPPWQCHRDVTRDGVPPDLTRTNSE
jgi:hypothetical protein